MSFIKLSLLPSGFLTLPEHFFCADQLDRTVKNTVPSMSFLLQHSGNNLKIIFDLGLRKNLEHYSEEIRSHLRTRTPITTAPDTSDSLRKGGLEPSEISAVILSHVHYDHVGTPSDFSNAKFIVGSGTKHLLKHGMKYHSAAKFEENLLPHERTIELPSSSNTSMKTSNAQLFGLDVLIPGVDHSWKPLATFENAIDLFGDGLVFIIDSPGHLAGHINLLVKIARRQWVYLAGDACHHRRLLCGETEMASWEENGMRVCIHADKDQAMDTLSRIRALMMHGMNGGEQVDVVLAHDAEWFHSHQDAIWPSELKYSSTVV